MPIATQMMTLARELEQARLSYRRGLAKPAALHHLDARIAALLEEARDTPHLLKLQCMQGMVRSLEARILQQERLARQAADAWAYPDSPLPAMA